MEEQGVNRKYIFTKVTYITIRGPCLISTGAEHPDFQCCLVEEQRERRDPAKKESTGNYLGFF